MITGHRLKRNLNFLKLEDEIEKEASHMAGIVFDMTGSWLDEIQCDDIMSPERFAPM